VKRTIPGLETASTAHTTAFRHAQIALGQALHHRDIGVLSGEPGSGKTYALEAFLGSPAMDSHSSTWLDMPPKPAAKEVLVRTLQAVTGSANPRCTQYELTDTLVEVLRGSDHVLVIDEAHHLPGAGLQQLRYLHTQCEFTFTLLLAGSDLASAMGRAPELRSRVESIVVFAPMNSEDLLPTLRSWHPLLAASPSAELRRIDQIWGRGNFRAWAKFLRTAIELAAVTHTDTLTTTLTDSVLTILGADGWSTPKSPR
jgi:hypothetical protein